MRPGGELSLDHLPGKRIRKPDKADLAAAHQIVERSHRFLERRKWVLVMLPIEVDVIGSQTPQRRFAGRGNGFAISPAAVRVFRVKTLAVLRRDDQPIPFRGIGAQMLADDLLRASASILIRGVDEIAATIDVMVDDLL